MLHHVIYLPAPISKLKPIFFLQVGWCLQARERERREREKRGDDERLLPKCDREIIPWLSKCRLRIITVIG